MNKNHLPVILDALSEGVFLIDGGRRIQFANKSARQLFGEGVVGYNFVRAVRHPDFVNSVDQVLGGQDDASVTIQLYRPAATVYQVNVVGIEPSDPDHVRAVVSIVDISHVHEVEQMRSDFVANVSHELRSPLTSLTGFIETLKGAARDAPEVRARFLSIMEQEANRMNRLIGDLLSLSRVESNARIRPTERSDVPSIIERVITLLSLQAESEGKTIRLVCETTQPMVPGDDDELTQVFQNLIENSLKYSSPESEVVVNVTDLQHVPALRVPALSIAVRDKGPGIPQSHIPRLTERFYRVDAGRSRDKGGTGLGLAIVKHIISRHRGSLQIASEMGVGSVFTVLLPRTASAR